MQSINNKSVSIFSEVQLRLYGDEAILFHAGTGDTLLLHPHAVSLIQLLKKTDSPVIVDDAIHAVAEAQDFELDEHFSKHILSLVHELARQEVITIS